MVAVPAVIKDNERSNRGFESLTRTRDATTMWAATEEALLVDGPGTTPSNGSVVRLVKFDVDGNTVATGPQLVLLGNAGDSLRLEATVDSVMVLLSGEPIDEPIVGYGPFVMNTQDEIRQAIADINNGRFGQISP
jgi:redox-sensitive bicupin YhaK (pirin superfamily)